MYKAAIRKNETGEIRFKVINNDFDDGDMWNWTEGNYSCDCNRELFWNSANGESLNFDNTRCSDDRFSVLYVELSDGSKIKIEE